MDNMVHSMIKHNNKILINPRSTFTNNMRFAIKKLRIKETFCLLLFGYNFLFAFYSLFCMFVLECMFILYYIGLYIKTEFMIYFTDHTTISFSNLNEEN